MARKTREETQGVVSAMITDAVQFAESDLSQRRAKAAQYYNGEMPDLPNVKNRSQVVMTVFRDAVLKLMPSMMRVFFGSEQPVEYMPLTTDPRSLKKAADATKYIANVVIRQDNQGFLNVYSWIKDTLIKRMGVVMWWSEDVDNIRGDCRYLRQEEIDLLEGDEHFEVVSTTQTDLPGLFKVEVINRSPNRKTRFAAIPPEEYIYSKGARTTEHDPGAAGVAALVGRVTQYTRSALIAMGVDPEEIDEHGGLSSALKANAEELARRSAGDSETAVPMDPAMVTHDYAEVYAYVDVDGDEYAELRRFCCLGPAHYVVNGDGDGEYADERPFADMSPDPEPHVVEGRGPADWTMDLQKTITSVMRAILDSLALSLINRYAYAEGDVNPDDVDSQELGTGIRVRQGMSPQQVLTQFSHNFVGREGLGVLDVLNSVVENRTGSPQQAGGLDADSMQSTTRAAIAAQVSAAQERIELVARVMCEQGFRRLYRGLLNLETKYAYESRIMRIAPGAYVSVDPRDWEPNMDVAVNIGIGGGLKEERAMVLEKALGKAEQLLMTVGPTPVMDMPRYRELLVKWLQTTGRADAEQIFGEIPEGWAPPQPPGDQKQDPNLMIAQAEVAKAQSKLQTDAAQSQLDAQEAQVEAARKMRDQELRELEIRLVDQRERERIEVDAAIRLREMNMKYNTQTTMEQIRADAQSKIPPMAKRTVKVTRDESGQASEYTVEEPTGA